MSSLLDHLVLQRSPGTPGTPSPAATVGMISLPLPRQVAGRVAIDHPLAAMHPVGWWVRHELPRRALAIIVDDQGVPQTLRLSLKPSPLGRGQGEGTSKFAGASGNTSATQTQTHPHPSPLPGEEGAKWHVSSRITKEKLPFKPPRFYDIASLRGVPAEDCTTVEFELLLRYGSRELAVQFGATGPSTGDHLYYWQNVQIDPLWSTPAAQALRVGGVIYNGDTYLWADLYLLLFANGVAHAAVHFVNTKLHIGGYDFQGLPTVRLALLEPSPSGVLAAPGRGQGEGTSGRQASPNPGTGQTQTSPHPNPLPEGEGVRPFPACGTRLDLPGLKLNLDDAAQLAGPEHPGTLQTRDNQIFLQPFSRTFNPQLPGAPPHEWPVGFARTVRFQFSLSDAAPVIARYRAPAWWYAAAGEPWPGGYLPVDGPNAPISAATADDWRPKIQRGRFDAGSAGQGNDGYLGTGFLQSYYHTARPELFTDALDYCYYWADIAVDHTDFSVHQWVGGWPWKTCAYSKFRDVLYGYLETGDPYLLDTVEMAAEAYWMWFRANWPRCTIGRDAFEIGGWALLRRFLASERARERTDEFVRMIGLVLDGRGVIGGQMGGGPHPGYVSSLYMSGVAMTSLLAVAEAVLEENRPDADASLAEIARLVAKVHPQWTRDDVEMFPSNFGHSNRSNWGIGTDSSWALTSGRVYTLLARLSPDHTALAMQGLRKAMEKPLPPTEERARHGRVGDNFLEPLYQDALTLGARFTDDAVELNPLPDPALWPAEATVQTPHGPLQIRTTTTPPAFHFTADKPFPVILHWNGQTLRTDSRGTARLGTVASGC